MKRWKWFLLSLLLLCVASAASAKGEEENGNKVYHKYCVVCHGVKGDGNGPAGKALRPKPGNFTKGVFKQGCSLAELVKTISEGVPKSPMVGFQKSLKKPQIRAVALYILKTFVPKKKAEVCLSKSPKEKEQEKKEK